MAEITEKPNQHLSNFMAELGPDGKLAYDYQQLKELLKIARASCDVDGIVDIYQLEMNLRASDDFRDVARVPEALSALLVEYSAEKPKIDDLLDQEADQHQTPHDQAA